MTKRKYKLHNSENSFGRRSEQKYIKEGLGGNLDNRDKAVEYLQKSKKKWKRNLKYPKKQKNGKLHGKLHQIMP